MKNHLKPKNDPLLPKAGPEAADALTRIEQQLLLLEKKLDILIRQVPVRPFEARPPQPPVNIQRPAQQPPQRPEEQRPQPPFQGRILHKAVCADCKKDCEVPFKPSADRPVYCKECFAKRKVERRAQGGHGIPPKPLLPAKEGAAATPAVVETASKSAAPRAKASKPKKPVAKKKPAAKKAKKKK